MKRLHPPRQLWCGTGRDTPTGARAEAKGRWIWMRSSKYSRNRNHQPIAPAPGSKNARPAFILRILSIHIPFLLLPPSSASLVLCVSPVFCLPLFPPRATTPRRFGRGVVCLSAPPPNHTTPPPLPPRPIGARSGSARAGETSPLTPTHDPARSCLCSPCTTTPRARDQLHARNTTPRPIAPAPGSKNARPVFILRILPIHVPLFLPLPFSGPLVLCVSPVFCLPPFPPPPPRPPR